MRGASRGRRLVGAAGRVGPAGVTLRFAIAQSGARLWGDAAGAQPLPPPTAGSVAPHAVREREGWQRRWDSCGERQFSGEGGIQSCLLSARGARVALAFVVARGFLRDSPVRAELKQR